MKKAIAIFSLVGCLLTIANTHPLTAEEKIKEDFFKTVLAVQGELQDGLLGLYDSSRGIASVKIKCEKARRMYARCEHILAYYFSSEHILLNSPPLPRFNDDNPEQPPRPASGLQLLEQQLADSVPNIVEIHKSILFIDSMFQSILRKKDFEIDISELMQAYRLHMLRIASIYLSGADAPISQDEAISRLYSSIDQMREEWLLLTGKDAELLKQRASMVRMYLAKNHVFEKFDRFTFLRDNLVPLYKQLQHYQIVNGIPFKEVNSPINHKAENMNSSDYFKALWFARDQSVPPTAAQMVELGKLLFYDPVLSGEANRSCATCHNPAKGFTDGLAKSMGLDSADIPRNAPTLLNACLQGGQFWDIRVNFLETQVKHVVGNTREMKGNWQQVIQILRNSPAYASKFAKVFNYDSDTVISQKNIARAIAMYERSLISLNSPFDIALMNKGNINKSAQRGFNLFMGKANCGTCHFFPLFNGTVPPDYWDAESEVLGTTKTFDTVKPILDSDIGRQLKMPHPFFNRSFKTATIRNAAITAPYMHNGGFKTLYEVVEFYNQGGGAGLGLDVPNQTLSKQKLKLTKKEKADLVAFMQSLTDTASLTNIPSFLPDIVFPNGQIKQNRKPIVYR